jgi:hypothetical protein
MATNYAYTNDTRKWGLFSRAILKRPELLSLFESKGIKKLELENVSITEDTARQADNSQRDAEQKLSIVTPQIKFVQDTLLGIFSELKLRIPNVARDLQAVKNEESAKAVLDLSFSERAVPRVPGEVEETLAESTEEDPEDEAIITEDRDSKAQKSLANAALRTEEYLRDKKAVIQALLERKMPSTFLEELKNKGEELLHLREERILLLEKRKKATRAEHDAVKAHIQARGVIEPTVSALASKESSIDALAVEHLGRKSAQKKE